MSEKVRWGIIGAGDVCERKSGPPLYEIDRSELTVVYRRNRAQGEDFVRRHGGRYVGTFDELLAADDIDAIYVASPHKFHAEQSILALEAGKHVLVEKPMALSASDCSEMIEAARRAGRSLAVAYYRRGYPSVRRVKQLLAEGNIGEVTEMSINNEFPTSHRLDLVHFLLGDAEAVQFIPGTKGHYRFERMTGRIKVRVVDVDSEGKPAAETVVTLAETWTETGMAESLTLRGTKGAVFLRDLKGGLIDVETAEGRERLEERGLPFTHWGLIENFVAHLLDGAPLLCDGVEGRKSTVILDALNATDEGTEHRWKQVHY